MTRDPEPLSRPGSWIVDALRAEGVPTLFGGYQGINLNTLFRNLIAYGTAGFPLKGFVNRDSAVTYGHDLCPMAEDLHQRTFLGLNLCAHPYIDQIVDAFHKVSAHLKTSA